MTGKRIIKEKKINGNRIILTEDGVVTTTLNEDITRQGFMTLAEARRLGCEKIRMTFNRKDEINR